MTLNLTGYHASSCLYTGTRTLVYRAKRQQDGRSVIIKVLRNAHPNFNELVQFRNQYAIAHSLQHPAILRPLALERYDNGYALIMPDDGAIALGEYWQQSPRSLVGFLNIAQQITTALHCLSQKQIIHKDIKPANIIINPQTQQIKLIDFSIASLLPKEQQQLTNPNVLAGSLAYLSPEQTGRMNRGLDYRSDFYGLGVTLFELLTNQLPFNTEDLLELIHCHLAQLPEFPANSDVPEILQAIVLKLMAKNAEDRYQSALGLQYDLAQCRKNIISETEIASFTIGTQDRGDRFLIPEKLYGRETEVKMLLEACDRVAQGTTEIVMVAGFSGIGKTAVINEIHKPIVKQRGYFIKGKFDQFNRSTPFSAWLQAFRNLIDQLLGETDAQLQYWQTQILAALEDNAAVLIEILPELIPIIGPQPPATELSGSAAKNRFNALLVKFIRVFTTQNRPLVIFLDDLQWADSASLQLLKLLSQDIETGYLLIVGAYRDNEVFSGHPLLTQLQTLAQKQVPITTLTLKSLTFENVNYLVADSLYCSPALAEPLSRVLYQNTQGNPFFTTQVLQGLYQDRLIEFNRNLGYWECDLSRVNTAILSQDAISFMVQRLRKLPPVTQQILQTAACIGNQFELELLALVCQESPKVIANHIWNALQEGLIVPLNHAYKFFQDVGEIEPQTAGINVSYRFLHDRIQQAAYFLIPNDQKQATHWQIGLLLLNNIPVDQQESQIFTIIGQLNQGLDCLESQSQRDAVMQLNLIAAQKAKTATAYETALQYATLGLSLCREADWQNNYELTLNLHNLATEVAYLYGDFAKMDTWGQKVRDRAHQPLDKIQVYNISCLALIAQQKLAEATTTGLEILGLLNITFPETPTPEDIEQASRETTNLINEAGGIEALLQLPHTTDKTTQSAIEIIQVLMAPTAMASPLLFVLLTLAGIRLSIVQGNSDLSAYLYSCYSIASFPTGHLDESYQLSQLALNLLPQFDRKETDVKTLINIGGFANHWRSHLRENITFSQSGYTLGLEIGELYGMAWNGFFANHALYFAGAELSELLPKVTSNSQLFKKVNQDLQFTHNERLRQVILNLTHPQQKPWELKGEAYHQDNAIAQYQAAQDRLSLYFLYCHQSILNYLFEHYLEAAAASEQAAIYIDSATCQIVVPVFCFYQALIALANPSPNLELVATNQAKMELWAEKAAMNFQHKLDLIIAEKYRVLGQYWQAAEYYDRAITAAQTHQYIQEEALAQELAAKFYQAWGKEKIAAIYLQEAYYNYARWGAKTKTNHLEDTYPQLLETIINRPQTVAKNSQISTSIPSLSTVTTATSIFDLAAILEVSQALSQEIELEALLTKLMQIILKNSGADKGVLVLNAAETWEVVAQFHQDSGQLVKTALEQSREVPQTILNTVKRNRKTLLIHNLEYDTTFTGDSYLMQQPPRSLLCLPILHQAQLIGLLYLENKVMANAFTPERLEVLNVLVSQAAISLENARLYRHLEEYNQNLETQVQQRTQQLKEKNESLKEALKTIEKTQVQLIQAEKMSGLGQMVAGLAHEINNPINFISGNITHAREYFHDLINIISLYQAETPQPSATLQTQLEDIELPFLQEDLEKLLKSMETGSDRIRNIIQGLKNFSRLQEAKRKPVDIHEGLNNTLLILHHRLKGSRDRPKIVVQKNYGNLPLITCYASQLNQVFLNIITNAIDALTTPTVHPQPQISITTESLENQQVRICITDNGEGMPVSVREKIFNPFFTTKPVGQGTGLGLSIGYQIVNEQHGGQLSCTSEIGQGTTFTIELPI